MHSKKYNLQSADLFSCVLKYNEREKNQRFKKIKIAEITRASGTFTLHIYHFYTRTF